MNRMISKKFRAFSSRYKKMARTTRKATSLQSQRITRDGEEANSERTSVQERVGDSKVSDISALYPNIKNSFPIDSGSSDAEDDDPESEPSDGDQQLENMAVVGEGAELSQSPYTRKRAQAGVTPQNTKGGGGGASVALSSQAGVAQTGALRGRNAIHSKLAIYESRPPYSNRVLQQDLRIPETAVATRDDILHHLARLQPQRYTTFKDTLDQLIRCPAKLWKKYRYSLLLFAIAAIMFNMLLVLSVYQYYLFKSRNVSWFAPEQKPPISLHETKSSLDGLYNDIVSMAGRSNDAIWRDELGELAAQIVDQLTWLGDKQQPPLPIVFVTMPSDDAQSLRLQRCFIDQLMKLIQLHAVAPNAVVVDAVNFAQERETLVASASRVTELLDYRMDLLQQHLGREYQDYGLKAFIGEQLDMLPSAELVHLAPLFPLLSGDTRDRRFIWAFTLSKAPPALSTIDYSRLSVVEAGKAVRRSMEQYLSSVWLSDAYSSEKLAALYARLVTTILVPSSAARDIPQCSQYRH